MPDAGTVVAAAAMGAVCALKELAVEKNRCSKFTCGCRSLRSAADKLVRARRSSDQGLRLGRQHCDPAFRLCWNDRKDTTSAPSHAVALASVGLGHGQRAVVYDAKQDTLSILSGGAGPLPYSRPKSSRRPFSRLEHAADIQSPAAALQVTTISVPEPKTDANPFLPMLRVSFIASSTTAIVTKQPTVVLFWQCRNQRLRYWNQAKRRCFHAPLRRLVVRCPNPLPKRF